jgi:hypothetical protein
VHLLFQARKTAGLPSGLSGQPPALTAPPFVRKGMENYS